MDAYESLSAADRWSPLGAEDLELIATSAYMLGREDEFLALLERAHRATSTATSPSAPSEPRSGSGSTTRNEARWPRRAEPDALARLLRFDERFYRLRRNGAPKPSGRRRRAAGSPAMRPTPTPAARASVRGHRRSP